MRAPVSPPNSLLVVLTPFTQQTDSCQRHNIETTAEAVCLCFSLLELCLAAIRGPIHHKRSCASFNKLNDHECHHSKQPEVCMRSDGQLDSWLPGTIGLAFIHLGSPICMRIVSNFAITHRMVPSAWGRKWIWHLDIVSVERCEMAIQRLALTSQSRRSTNWKRQYLPPTNRHRTFCLQQGCWGSFSSVNMRSVLVYRTKSST